MSLKSVCLEGNKWVTLTTIGAAITGITLSKPKFDTAHTANYLFFVFLVLLRVKLYLDDQYYFLSVADYKSKNFKVGMTFALASWICMIVSGIFTKDISDNNSYFFMLISISLSLLWIVSEALRVGAYREQYLWIAANAIYVALLAFLIWLHPQSSPVYNWLALALLVGVTFADLVASDPLTKLHDLETKL